MAEQLLSRRTVYAWLFLLGTMGISIRPGSESAELLAQCPFPVGLISLAGRRLVGMSPQLPSVLFLEPGESDGADLHTLVDDPKLLDALFDLISGGSIDAYEARRKLRRRDGSRIDAENWVTVTASASREWALWIVAPLGQDAGGYLPEPAETAWPLRVSGLVVGTFDSSWRLERVSEDVQSVVGRPAEALVGVSFLDLLHPGDITAFYMAVAQALSDRSGVGVAIRVEHRPRGWRSVQIVITPLASTHVQFGFALSVEPAGGGDIAERGIQLERHLRRIAHEVEAAGVVAGFDVVPDLEELPGLAHLSSRQWEILTRMVRGERVPGIAKELFLSQSTVRNHLSNMFRKLGINSQEALLALLRAKVREQARDRSAVPPDTNE